MKENVTSATGEISRSELISHLRRYLCRVKQSGRWGEIYWREATGVREFIPRAKKVPFTLARKICDSLETCYPESIRENLEIKFDRTFDNAVQSLKNRGLSPIRKRKYRMATQTQPKEYGGKTFTFPTISKWEPVPLEKEEELTEKEFWVPVGFHGNETWITEICAPPWTKGKAARTRWINRYCKESQWPDHGERAEDPTRFLNQELGILKCDLKGSPDIPEKHRKKVRETLQDLGVIGSEYLAEAIELALKSEPKHRQLKKEELLEHSAISSYVEERITRALELAYRAGRVQATRSSYYRGVPYMAQDGAPTVLRLGKGRPPKEEQKKSPKLRKWQKRALPLLKENPHRDRRDLLEHLVKKKAIIEEPVGTYRECEIPAGGTTFEYASFTKKVVRFIKAKKIRTV